MALKMLENFPVRGQMPGADPGVGQGWIQDFPKGGRGANCA